LLTLACESFVYPSSDWLCKMSEDLKVNKRPKDDVSDDEQAAKQKKGADSMKEENANGGGQDDGAEVVQDDEKKDVDQGTNDFMATLEKVWEGTGWSKTGGLLFRTPDISTMMPDIEQSLEKYGEIGVFTRKSPPVIWNGLSNKSTPYPQPGPIISVLFDPAVLSKGYRVAAFDAHPLYRYPYTRFYDPGRPCLDSKRNGHAENLYVDKVSIVAKTVAPVLFSSLLSIGTVSGAQMLSGSNTQDPKLDMFGLSKDKLPPCNQVDVASDLVDQGGDGTIKVHPRKYHNASGTPALGTLNAWQPYYDSIDTAMAVRNVNMLVPDDDTRLEMMKLWAGGVAPSIWPNKVLCNDPETGKSPIIGFSVAHHGSVPYTATELKTYKLNTTDNIKNTVHDALDDFMTYYFGDDGTTMIENLCKAGCVVELFNSVLASQGKWERGATNQWSEAVQGVTDYVKHWMAADKEEREKLTNYARQLPAYQ